MDQYRATESSDLSSPGYLRSKLSPSKVLIVEVHKQMKEET